MNWLLIKTQVYVKDGRTVSGQLPPLSPVSVSFRVGEANQTIAPEENCPPVRVRAWLRISFGVGGGAIFHGGNCPGTVKAYLQRFPFCRHFILFCYRNSHRCCSIKKTFLKYFAIITRKHLFWGLFLIKLQAFSPATLWKRNSNRAAFLWILQNF